MAVQCADEGRDLRLRDDAKQAGRQGFFNAYAGILHTDGYVAYEKDIGAKGMIHACCLAHARRGSIDAIKVQTKSHVRDMKFHPTDKDRSVGTPALERVVVLMDSLFAIDREAREQRLSRDDRHALRMEHMPALLSVMHML